MQRSHNGCVTYLTVKTDASKVREVISRIEIECCFFSAFIILSPNLQSVQKENTSLTTLKAWYIISSKARIFLLVDLQTLLL